MPWFQNNCDSYHQKTEKIKDVSSITAVADPGFRIGSGGHWPHLGGGDDLWSGHFSTKTKVLGSIGGRCVLGEVCEVGVHAL